MPLTPQNTDPNTGVLVPVVTKPGQPSHLADAVWGRIVGALSNQTDLWMALDAKAERGAFATAAQGAKADTALQGGAGLAALDSAAASKLSGIAPGATANDPDADLRDRATHTGEQPLDSLAQGGAVDGDVIQWDAALGRWVARTPPDAGVSATRTELMVSDTDSPPVILTNEDATDFLYST